MKSTRTLSRAQLRELERALRGARARLERAMARARAHRIAERMRGAPTPHGEAGASRRITLDPRTLARHLELVAATRRLESGTYGVCVSCAAPIDYQRLARDPKLAHCAECAARLTRQNDPSGSHRPITHFTE